MNFSHRHRFVWTLNWLYANVCMNTSRKLIHTEWKCVCSSAFSDIVSTIFSKHVGSNVQHKMKYWMLCCHHQLFLVVAFFAIFLSSSDVFAMFLTVWFKPTFHCSFANLHIFSYFFEALFIFWVLNCVYFCLPLIRNRNKFNNKTQKAIFHCCHGIINVTAYFIHIIQWLEVLCWYGWGKWIVRYSLLCLKSMRQNVICFTHSKPKNDKFAC